MGTVCAAATPPQQAEASPTLTGVAALRVHFVCVRGQTHGRTRSLGSGAGRPWGPFHFWVGVFSFALAVPRQAIPKGKRLCSSFGERVLSAPTVTLPRRIGGAAIARGCARTKRGQEPHAV